MLFYLSKVLFVYQQVTIVQKYASKSRIFHFLKTVLSHLKSDLIFPRLIPLYLQCLTSCFSVLVKMCGAMDRPNGKSVKIKYLRVLLSGNFQANPKNVWYSGWISMWWYPFLRWKYDKPTFQSSYFIFCFSRY
jgi:hypothetical protein